MASVFDVAEYILEKMGPLTAAKLQKLVYYCQAWHLVWTENLLFADKIEAWRNGPIVPALFDGHKGHFKLNPGFFYEKYPKETFSLLEDSEKDVIDRVLEYYGHRDAHWLSQLAHMEEPWKTTRARNQNDQDYMGEEITPHSIFEYYCSL